MSHMSITPQFLQRCLALITPSTTMVAALIAITPRATFLTLACIAALLFKASQSRHFFSWAPIRCINVLKFGSFSSGQTPAALASFMRYLTSATASRPYSNCFKLVWQMTTCTQTERHISTIDLISSLAQPSCSIFFKNLSLWGINFSFISLRASGIFLMNISRSDLDYRQYR